MTDAEQDSKTDIEQNEVDTDQSRSFKPGPQGIAGLLVVGGVVLGLVQVIRGKRGLTDWLLPLGLAGAGVAVFVTERKARISEAEQKVMAELDGLDPVAKAQVLKAVADKEFHIQESLSRKGSD
jgi:hypothetical protein